MNDYQKHHSLNYGLSVKNLKLSGQIKFVGLLTRGH